jgi:hypothetical protein
MSISLGTDLSNNGIAFGAAAPTGGIPVGNQETTSSGGGGGGGSSTGGNGIVVVTTELSNSIGKKTGLELEAYTEITTTVKAYEGEHDDSK